MNQTLRDCCENKTTLDVSEFFGGESLDSRFETLTTEEIDKLLNEE